MLSAAQQSFDSCWEEFPVISQNNSLVIIPCDRQTVCLASNVFQLWSSVWDGWVKGSPWAWEELVPSLGQWYWRGRGCQRHRVRMLESHCLTAAAQGTEKSPSGQGTVFCRKELMAEVKLGSKDLLAEDQMKEKLVFTNFNLSLQ